jgi:hypothetical protein
MKKYLLTVIAPAIPNDPDVIEFKRREILRAKQAEMRASRANATKKSAVTKPIESKVTLPILKMKG